MHRTLGALAFIALTPFTASLAYADVISITAGSVFFDLDEIDYRAMVSGSSVAISGFVVGPGSIPCLSSCGQGDVLDVSATHKIGAGVDLFGFGGEARIGSIVSPTGDATLVFSARPVRAREFATTPFSMTGQVRVLGDDGSVLAVTDVRGRGTAHLGFSARRHSSCERSRSISGAPHRRRSQIPWRWSAPSRLPRWCDDAELQPSVDLHYQECVSTGSGATSQVFRWW